MKRLIAMAMVFMLVGCATEPRSYNSGLAKHPYVLTLQNDGTYRHEQLFTDNAIELGRWWELNEQIVVLMPNAVDRPIYYAYRLDEPTPFGNYWLYDDLRAALNNDQWFSLSAPLSASDWTGIEFSNTDPNPFKDSATFGSLGIWEQPQSFSSVPGDVRPLDDERARHLIGTFRLPEEK